jgi:hypothetical protein
MNNNKSLVKSMRLHWFDHVAKTRKKMSRGKKEDTSHRDAMQEASKSWPTVKKKIERKLKRTQKQVKSTGVIKM